MITTWYKYPQAILPTELPCAAKAGAGSGLTAERVAEVA